jgi:hypothetical protein
MPYLPINSGWYESPIKPIASQELVNWYVYIPETNALTESQWLPTPGLVELFNTGDDEPNRGGIVVDGIPYFVNGKKLYRLNQSFDPLGNEVLSVTDLGAINGVGLVSIDTNGDQICIVVPASVGYVYNIATSTLTQITSAAYNDLGPSVKVKYIDGYFVHVGKDQRTAFNSALNDGLTYDGLDFTEAESDPDGLVTNHAFGGKLFLMGQTTTEVYANSGGLQFPFQRSYVVSIGCIAKYSVANFGSTFAFLGQDVGGQPSVYAFDGNGFARISNGAIDAVLQRTSPTELRDAFALSYSQDGAIFWCLNLKGMSFVYDALASKLKGSSVWHERKSFGLDNKQRWRVNCICQAYGRYLVGDSEGGSIGDMRTTYFSEYGNNIRRTGVAGPFKEASGPLFWRKIEALVNPGQGDSSTPDPQIRMSYSDDGGYTWSFESPRSIGTIGQYSQQVTWYSLGRSLNSRMFKFEMSDKVQCSMIGLVGEYVK